MKVDKGEASSPITNSILEDDMEAKEAQELIGSEVYWNQEKKMADIVAVKSGWVTIKTDDGEQHKVRAKSITLMDSEEDIVEQDGEITTVEAPEGEVDPSKASSAVALEVGMEVECGCGNTFPAPKIDSYKCPNCGVWHHVRLHPDMERYVKGMDATASGRDTVDINDEVATELRGLRLEDLYFHVCDKLMELDEKARFSKAMARDFVKSENTCSTYLENRYGHLNPGMQRMNLGNLLRGAYKRQAEINIKTEIENGK